jgi:hypothetical protein
VLTRVFALVYVHGVRSTRFMFETNIIVSEPCSKGLQGSATSLPKTR